MRIEIELNDEDAARALEALGGSWRLTDTRKVMQRRRPDAEPGDDIEVDQDVPRSATSAELHDYVLKQLRSLVRQHEDRQAQIERQPRPFAGK